MAMCGTSSQDRPALSIQDTNWDTGFIFLLLSPRNIFRPKELLSSLFERDCMKLHFSADRREKSNETNRSNVLDVTPTTAWQGLRY